MSASAEIKQLSLYVSNHRQHLQAVDELELSLIPGQTLALLGESGCGKSLTALALMRLLPVNALYGAHSQVVVDGEDLLQLPENWMRQLRGRKLAMVFQEPMTALNPVLTIGQQLSEVLLRQGPLSRLALREQMVRLLQEVEMPNPELRLAMYPHQLSGGQKQRVVIAMALAAKPEILIADEPTTALDVTIQAQILSLLKRLQVQYQMAMLLITHDLSVVKAVADQVCVMYAGQVVEQASVSDFFKEVKHPYSQQLKAALPSFDKRAEQLAVIKGSVPNLDAMPGGCRFHPRCAHRFQGCDQIEPLLQNFHGREVRCHLYPAHQSLPDLTHQKVYWSNSTENQETVLDVTDLSVHFYHRKPARPWSYEVVKAVDQLSFQLQRGKTLALVGESGCGKTTASRALLRLLPTASGQILFGGQSVLALSGRALRDYRKKVQIILQDPFSSMNPRMTVAEIIAEGMVAQGIKSALIEKKLLTLVDQVNLPKGSLSRYPHQFSGGQRQRICIARALATEPELLICDEPTSALDISVQAQIINLLKTLQQERGLTYLFITHNMAVVAYLADEVLVMKDGRVVEKGGCEQIMKTPQAPYTQQLLAAAN